ncbi:MAG: type II secretion system GspH family protein [Muribaculaceae bacterium]|nr:type II secretion system GspH family protein [Muribaculaceae bacterium]
MKRGFTLAEVLITLGIIGIVSAMTIPTLIKNHQKKILIEKAKQGHSILQNNIRRYMANNMCDDMLCLFDITKSTEEVAKEFSETLNSSHICTKYEKKFCSSYPIKANNVKNAYKVDGKYQAPDSFNHMYRIYLPNGISYVIIMSQNTCTRTGESIIRDKNGFDTGERKPYTIDRCALVYMDTNGLQGPNQDGADIFSYSVHSNGTIEPSGNYMKNIIEKNYIDYTPYNLGDDVK